MPPLVAVAKDYEKLWEGVAKATNEVEAVRALAQIVFDKHGRAFTLGLKPKDAELCVETLDYGITEQHLKTAEKAAFFLTLRRLAEQHELLPDRMRIREPIEVSNEIAAAGGFGDVRIGWYDEGLVAVKTVRVAARDNIQKIRKRFYKEVILWETLSHPNILKLVGVQEDIGKRQFVTVSEWMEHGNIMEYIRKNHAKRLELLHGACQGLKYLHGVGLTHGDLKGANILISNGNPPRACLADFGFITTILCPGQWLSESAQIEGGTTPFTAPELLVPQKYGRKGATPTTEADVYAFGLVIFQVLTGESPFHGIQSSALVYAIVQEGKRPKKPENASAIGISDPLWDFVQRCWDADAKSRPAVGEVVTVVGAASDRWNRFMPPCPLAEDVDSGVEEISDSKKYFALFQLSPKAVSTSRTDSGSTLELVTCPSTPSTQLTELTTKESQEVVTRFGQMQLDPPVAVELRQGLHDVGPDSAEVFPHIDTPHNPHPAPPHQEKQREQKGFRIPKLRELLGLGR